jgi:DNA-directed RNA polymerase subunit N (RpoN/RPB10)
LAHKEVQSKQFLEYKRKVREVETWEKRMDVLERKIIDTYNLALPDRMERPPRKGGDVANQLSEFVQKVESELDPNEKFFTDTRSNVM